MPTVNVSYGAKSRTIEVASGTNLGDAIATTELPLEQPCAGRGTCGKCRVLVEIGSSAPDNPLGELDSVEHQLLSTAEQTAGYRLACRAQVLGDVSVLLAPVVVYSNKMFRVSERFRTMDAPLGLAVDLGSTTVAAFLVNLETGEVCRGAAALNQQTTYGADVISRLAASRSGSVAKAPVQSCACLDRAGCGCLAPPSQGARANPAGNRCGQHRHAPPAAALACGHSGRVAIPALPSRQFAEGGWIPVGRFSHRSHGGPATGHRRLCGQRRPGVFGLFWLS
jgi:ferredoxin